VYTKPLHRVKFSEQNGINKKIGSAVNNEHHSSEHCLIKGNNNITKKQRLMQSEEVTFLHLYIFFTFDEGKLIFEAHSTFTDRKKIIVSISLEYNINFLFSKLLFA